MSDNSVSCVSPSLPIVEGQRERAAIQCHHRNLLTPVIALFCPLQKILAVCLVPCVIAAENGLLWVFFMLVRKYDRPKTANRHNGEKIMLSRQVLLSKTNVSESASYIPITSHTLFSFECPFWSLV